MNQRQSQCIQQGRSNFLQSGLSIQCSLGSANALCRVRKQDWLIVLVLSAMHMSLHAWLLDLAAGHMP